MMLNNPYAQYQTAQFETAPPEKLLLMLFDGAIRFTNTAMKAMEERNIQIAHTNCIKVQNILTELMSTLRFDVGGDIAKNLFDLYEYLHHRTITANMKKDPTILEEVSGHLRDLREAWAQAAKNAAAEKAKQASA
ncbi:MAG: flagellar export chaperone FliS [Candidatus Sericytochromatia bacterium]|uniref:Flagellar secretion chaperone FliS n=1 Tax=Candidatus Tanganyikabacteria bacterium TaxID=2961651 RepID=A0A937X4J7_9BACT|nr:flagellar export chaperone FliS [Candidatus Tanganyikabacteria bacterium]